jgi:hypothetical protein
MFEPENSIREKGKGPFGEARVMKEAVVNALQKDKGGNCS